MELDFLILADKAEAINGKLYMVGGAFTNIGLMQIPGPAQFDIALGVIFDYHETGDQHQLTIAIEDADNRPTLGPITIQLPVGRPPGLPPGDAIRLVMAIQGPFAIQAEGLYHVAVELDGQRAKPTRFRVGRVVPLIPQIPQARPA
jgi:hypothetical protein